MEDKLIVKDATKRSILRWIHIVFSIPILGYIYSPFEEIPKYAARVRFVVVPVMLLSGFWMWKGHVLRRLIFANEPSGKEVSRFVSVLAKRPRTLPPLPIRQPAGETWQVKVIGVTGRFALSVHRRLGRTLVYPNEVVEKNLGVSATARNWNTISAICDILKGR